jgi:hypothetical protein
MVNYSTGPADSLIEEVGNSMTCRRNLAQEIQDWEAAAIQS